MSVVRVRRSRSAVVTAATLGVMLATGAVLSAPAAYAADAPAATTATATTTTTAAPGVTEAAKPELTVHEPATIGHGGEPVEFTETVTNPGSAEASFTLKLDASNPAARGAGRVTIDYRAADGSWKPVALAFSQSDAFHFTGEVTGLTVAAGATRTVQLRIATPVNNDWGNQDSPIKLRSALLDQSGKTVLAESTKEITAKALTVQVKDAPTTAVVGGAPVEFDVTVNNASASRYTDVAKVVEADRRSTLQVKKADGSWENITGTPSTQPGSDRVSYLLTGDKSIAAGGSDTRHVRLAFTADAPLGTTYVHPWAVQDTGPGYAPAIRGPQALAIELTAAPVVAKPTLTVQEPASIGYAGEPVEFTETVTNPGTTEAPFTLKLTASNGMAGSPGRITVDYRDDNGTWKPLALTFKPADGTFGFTGRITGLTVAAGATRTVQLRLATPTDVGGALTQPIKLRSTVVDPAESAVYADTTKDVAVKSLAVEVKNAPTTAVAGGAPVEFDVTVSNPSASSYTNVTPALGADPNTTLQVQKADGTWESITGTAAPGSVVYHLNGNDTTLAAGATLTKHLRLAFTAGARTGKSYVNPWAVLNEKTGVPAYVGPQGFPVDITTAPATGGTGTATGTTTSTTTGSTEAGSTTARATGYTATTGITSADVEPAGGELARTGSDGMVETAASAAALLVSGIGALFVARRRRNA
ncbi:hypothetical protein [Kitasatospora sp. NPDC097643]|uniref:hypothetical protein n=1 Tax=Kitasatospora sp. NPDC097643 TaxID=3157230 RepID=UPI003334A158